MVNPDSGHQSFLDQIEWDAVNDGEYFMILYADRGQVVDIKKTTVLISSDATRQKLKR